MSAELKAALDATMPVARKAVKDGRDTIRISVDDYLALATAANDRLEEDLPRNRTGPKRLGTQVHVPLSERMRDASNG